MKAIAGPRGQVSLKDLLNRDHTLNGGIRFGIDVYVIENPAWATNVLRKAVHLGSVVSITGMPRGAGLVECFAAAEDEVSPKIRQMVQHARERQHARFQGTGIPFNAAIPGGHVRDFCHFAPAAFDHDKRVIETSSLSTRSMDRLAKVAQTLADLRGNDQIEVRNIDEAKGYVVGGILRDGM